MAVANKGGLRDERIRFELVLDRSRSDELAARGLEQLLLAVGDVEEPVGVEARDVSGAKEALLIEVFGGVRGLSPVARKDAGACDEQLSVVDQFGARLGVGAPLKFAKGLGASLSARMEGVPSSDLIGGSAGFRRPGYSIGIEPGLSYSWKRNSLSRRSMSSSRATTPSTGSSGG